MSNFWTVLILKTESEPIFGIPHPYQKYITSQHQVTVSSSPSSLFLSAKDTI